VTTAVGVMARAPSAAGKTRLAPHFSAGRLRALRSALLADTLAAVEHFPDVFIFFTPDEAALEFASIGGAAKACVSQGAGDLGARMLAATRHLLDVRGYDAALLIGSDIPLLTADHVADAVDALRASAERSASSGQAGERSAHAGIVLGPADDGGYYLIGMTHTHAGLFEGIAWGTDSVLTDTLRAAERIGVDARLVRSAYDVDTIEDVRRLERDLALAPAGACPHLRRWFSEA
jgi:rSAM/selenodomain-associated transferase 1